MKRPITLFDPSRIFADDFVDAVFGGAGLTFQYTNDLEMYEDENNVVVKFKAPGFKEEDMDITIEDKMLTITGNAEEEKEEDKKNKKYYYKEMRQSSFSRSINLPVRVVAESSKAEFKNGIITITMPKAEESKPKKVTINKTTV